jgi:hypothetical protein
MVLTNKKKSIMESKQIAPETKTKEDILSEYSDVRFNMGMPFNYEALYQAMQEFADQEKRNEASGLAQWVAKNNLISDSDGFWYYPGENDYEGPTGICAATSSGELYDLYLLSLTNTVNKP